MNIRPSLIRTSAKQLATDSLRQTTHTCTSPSQTHHSRRCLACSADSKASDSSGRESPSSRSVSSPTRPAWNSSPRLGARAASPRTCTGSSGGSRDRLIRNAMDGSVSANVEATTSLPADEQQLQNLPAAVDSEQTAPGQPVPQPVGNDSKRQHMADGIPGSEQVLGLVKEYMAPDSSRQEGQLQDQHIRKSKPMPAESVHVPPLPTSLLPSVGTSSELTQQQLQVLGAWYSMYCPDKEAQQVAALVKHYDPNAKFEDNFIQAFGRDQVGVQFYGMHRCVKDIRLDIEKVEVLPGTGNGTYQIRIISRIYFYLPLLIRGAISSLFLPPALEAWATDTLTVREADDIVLHHQQRVHNIPTLPWPVRVYLGVTSSLFMMHVLGW